MTSLAPRAVLVTRQTEYQALLAAHGTRGQVAFFLKNRDQSIEMIEDRHADFLIALQKTRLSVPNDWSIANGDRDDLDRFLFTANDIVIAVGQDGLVANLAKYVTHQPVIGVTPDALGSEGVLTATKITALNQMLRAIEHGEAKTHARTMVEANLGGGETLAALNELFIGHHSHQSAKYLLTIGDAEEFQSSSGVIVTTGTGATGWARSIMTATDNFIDVQPDDPAAVFFAREPWPSKSSGCTLKFGEIWHQETLQITSRINEGGVIFADGVEQDYLKFDWGRRASISVSNRTLNLVVG